jgi:outer membrane protein assembly factor BamB
VQPIVIDSIIVIASKKKLDIIDYDNNQVIKSFKLKTSIRNSSWTLDFEGYYRPITFQPLLSNKNTIYHVERLSTLRAIDVRTGNVKWVRSDIGNYFVRPIFENGNIYFTRLNKLFSISEETGNINWSLVTNKVNPISKEMMIIENTTKNVIVLDNNSNMFSVSKSSGKIIWKNDLEILSALSLKNKSEIICLTKDNQIQYLSKENGKIIRSINSNIKNDFDSHFVSSDESIFLIYEKEISKIDLINKKEVEIYNTSKSSIFLPFVYNNHIVYLDSHLSKFVSINLENGNIGWGFKITRFIPFPISENNSMFLIGDGVVSRVDLNTGKIISNYTNESIEKNENIDIEGLILMSIKDGKLSIYKK